jgi:hypothetical protein
MVKQYSFGVCRCYRSSGLCTQASESIICGSCPVVACVMRCVQTCGALTSCPFRTGINVLYLNGKLSQAAMTVTHFSQQLFILFNDL